MSLGRAAAGDSRVDRLPGQGDVLGLGPVAAEPGTSKMAGSVTWAGWESGAPRPAAPMVPWPMFSWRSRFAPSSTLASFRCRQTRRARPIVASKAATTSSALSTSPKSTPEAQRCCVSRQTLSLGAAVGPASSRMAASSSKARPTVSPVPAAFSSTSGQRPSGCEANVAPERVDHLGQAGVEALPPVAADLEHEAGGAHRGGHGEVVQEAGSGSVRGRRDRRRPG